MNTVLKTTSLNTVLITVLKTGVMMNSVINTVLNNVLKTSVYCTHINILYHIVQPSPSITKYEHLAHGSS